MYRVLSQLLRVNPKPQAVFVRIAVLLTNFDNLTTRVQVVSEIDNGTSIFTLDVSLVAGRLTVSKPFKTNLVGNPLRSTVLPLDGFF